jgi:hypothetical protein
MTDHRGIAAGFEAFTSLDPRHVFLDAREGMQRHGWGKTRGYQNLKERRVFPPPVVPQLEGLGAPSNARADLNVVAVTGRRVHQLVVARHWLSVIGPPPLASAPATRGSRPSPGSLPHRAGCSAPW